MSEHIWVEEALGGYLAGGLDRAERERLERHVAECGDCARELEQARGIDGRLDGLFAPIRPAPALEDRMIQAIRAQPLRRRFRISGWKRVLAAAAAVVLFGGVGAAFTAYMEQSPEGAHFDLFGTKAENRLKGRMLVDISGSMAAVEELVDPSNISTHSGLMHGTTDHGMNFSGPAMAKDFDKDAYLSMRGASIADGSVRHSPGWRGSSLGEFWVDNAWDRAGGDVPTGSMATKLWGFPRKGLHPGLQPLDGVPLGTDWGGEAKSEQKKLGASHDFGVPRSTMRGFGLSPDGRRLLSAGKKRVEDANDNQQKAENDISYSTDLMAGVSVPGLAKPDDLLRAQLESGKPADTTLLGRSGAAAKGRVDLADKEVASRLNASPSYFRPGELFARSDKKPEATPALGLPAPVTLGATRTESQVIKRTIVVNPTSKVFNPAELAFVQGKNGKDPKKDPVKPPRVDNRKIIRSGEIDFEVESFDDAVTAIMKLVNATNGGFVATVNSDKLANGKVRGSVVVRVPPEELDELVKKLRKIIEAKGDLKGQRIGSQDVTKQYTDIESRLRAARTMEERLLNIIKSGKGEIKDLVAAEKELGVWRTKIEEMEGEIRYYGNQIALSTLTVNLTEKEIRLAAAVAERERVQAGIEVDDVEKAYQEAQKAIADLKGRITKSDLKQGTAGQFNALLSFEVAPDSALLMRDRLRQLGNMVRLDIERVQTAEGGKMPLTGKVNRGDTQFQVSLYNLANVEPRETVTLKIAAADVAKAFRELRDVVAKVKGQVITSVLNEQDKQNVNGTFNFNVLRSGESAVQTALNDAGELLSRQVSRVPESDKFTDAKVRIQLELVPATAIPPRETMTLILEVTDVATTFRAFNDEVREAGGRVVQPPKLRQERTGKVLGRAVYDVPLSSASSLMDKFKAVGRTNASEVTPNPNAPDGKLAIARIEVVAGNGELLVPRDQGLWSEIRHGFATSLRGLSVSAGWLIIGVLFVLPWLVLLYVVVWATRKLLRRGTTP